MRACYFSRGKSLFGVTSTFVAALEFVVCVGDRFAVVETAVPIPEFQVHPRTPRDPASARSSLPFPPAQGTRSTSEGLDNFVRLPPGVRSELEARGAVYAGFASSAAFLEYAPGSFMPVPRAGTAARAPARSRGGGRVMVDAQAGGVRFLGACRI